MNDQLHEAHTTIVAKVNDVKIVVIENGEKRVAIKPICEALGIDYARQFSKLKTDEIYSSVIGLRPTTEHRTNAVHPICFLSSICFSKKIFRIFEMSKQIIKGQGCPPSSRTVVFLWPIVGNVLSFLDNIFSYHVLYDNLKIWRRISRGMVIMALPSPFISVLTAGRVRRFSVPQILNVKTL
jgi:hypothetical protein